MLDELLIILLVIALAVVVVFVIEETAYKPRHRKTG